MPTTRRSRTNSDVLLELTFQGRRGVAQEAGTEGVDEIRSHPGMTEQAERGEAPTSPAGNPATVGGRGQQIAGTPQWAVGRGDQPTVTNHDHPRHNQYAPASGGVRATFARTGD